MALTFELLQSILNALASYYKETVPGHYLDHIYFFQFDNKYTKKRCE